MSGARRLGLAGFCAIAVGFGPSRAGYGLFLPEFRDEFGFSIGLSGLVASGLQAGYLVALTLVGLLVARLGPRPFVILGMLAAGLGMALVALAPGAGWLAAGVVLAGTSAGWSWAPYNDAVERAVPEDLWGRVLSIISTGTTFGVLAAGLAALAVGASWRAGWFVFAAAALVAGAINAAVLPAGADGTGGASAPARPWEPGFLRRTRVASLFLVAFSFGAVSAFYWAFAVDLVSGATNALTLAIGPLFYVVVGIAGFAGLFVGDVVGRFGLVRVLVAVLASLCVSSALLGPTRARGVRRIGRAVRGGRDGDVQFARRVELGRLRGGALDRVLRHPLPVRARLRGRSRGARGDGRAVGAGGGVRDLGRHHRVDRGGRAAPRG